MEGVLNLGLLSDAEMSILSDRMTPNEFDRIALQYLLIKKVGMPTYSRLCIVM